MKKGILILVVGVVVLATAVALKETHTPCPEPGDYDIAIAAENQVGRTDPVVVAPGDTLKLFVSTDRKSVFGRWRAASCEVSVPPDAGISWAPGKVTSNTETWDEAMSFGYYASQGRTAETVNRPLLAWIRFRLPKKPDLYGTALRLHVRMKVSYPETETGDSYEEADFLVDRVVSFEVATKEKVAAYRKWKSDTAAWAGRRDLYGTLQDISFGILALCVVAGLILIIKAKR